jgi:hypothetical protein
MTGSVGLNFTPLEPDVAVAPGSAIGERVGFGEAVGAGFRSASELGFRRDDARRREAYGIYMDPIDRAIQGHIDLPDPIMRTVAEEGFDPSLETLGRIRSWVEENGAQYGYDPEEFDPPEDVIARREEILSDAAAFVDEQNEILGRAGPGTALAGQLIGGVGAEFTDPFNVLTLPAGAPARAGLLATMGVEAAINAGLELAELGARNRFAEELGQETQSPLEAATIGALFGAGGAAAMRGLEVGTIRGFERIGRFLSQRELRALAEAAAGSANPSEAALGNALLQDLAEAGQVGANTSRAAEEEHQRRLAEATAALNEGRAVSMPDQPATLRPRPDEPGGALEMADTRDIQIDTGRSDAPQRINEPFDPDRAGVAMIFEAEDGTRTLVDGRARLDAAREAGIDALPSRIYREADGFRIEDLRRVLDEMDGAEREFLPATLRAYNAMSDDAFNVMAMGGVDAGVAMVVARQMESSPELQFAMIRALQRAGINTPEGALRAMPELSRGLEPIVPEADYTARQKVTARAMDGILEDDELLTALREQRAAVRGEPAGAGSAAEDAILADELRSRVMENMGRNPALERAINAAAKHYAATGRLGDGAGRLLSELRGLTRSGALDRAGDSLPRADAEPQGPAAPAQDGNERFSDPIDGEGAAGQVAATPLVRDPPPEGFSDDLAGREDLKRRVEDGAPREEIDTHPALVRALEEMEARAEQATDLAEVYGTREWHDSRQYVFGSEVESGTRAAIPRWRDEAESFAGEMGPLREREVTILLGPPAAGKSTIAEGLALDRRAAILDPDEIKKTLPEYEGGIGAAAVHEESSDLAKMLEGVMREEGTNMIVPKVGGSPGSIRAMAQRFQESGYRVSIVNMAVSPDEAYIRMIGRFIGTGRIIPPKYMDAVGDNPTRTYQTLRDEGAADGFAEIDNNGGFNAPKPITERVGEFDPFAGSRFDLGAGRGSLLEAANGGAGAGDRGAGAADIIRRDALVDRVPIGVEQIDRSTTRATTMTRQELEDELVAEETFAEVLQYCVR